MFSFNVNYLYDKLNELKIFCYGKEVLRCTIKRYRKSLKHLLDCKMYSKLCQCVSMDGLTYNTSLRYVNIRQMFRGMYFVIL